MNTRPLLVGLAVLAMPGLSGCVAAIPAVAVLAMGGSQIEDNDNKRVTVITPPAPVAGPSQVASAPQGDSPAQLQSQPQLAAKPAPLPEPTPKSDAVPVPATSRQIVEAKPLPSAPSVAAQRSKADQAAIETVPSAKPAASARPSSTPMPSLTPMPAPQKPLAAVPLKEEPAPRPVVKPAERPVEMARLDLPKPDAPKPAAQPTAKPDPAPMTAAAPMPVPGRSQVLPPAPRDIGLDLLKPSTSPGYDQFRSFIEDRSADFNLGRGMKSVVYNFDSGLENPTFAQCGEKPLAIILDLDNNDLSDEQNAAIWRGAVDPAPGVLNAVNEARRLDIMVFYMSNQLAQSGIRIEAALNEAGLGPAEPGIQLWLKGERGLERKDLLRQVISRHYCVIAMAGDRKSDFADLYDYLRDPNTPAVRTLDPLFNAGWFMLPNPVVAAHSNDKD